MLALLEARLFRYAGIFDLSITKKSSDVNAVQAHYSLSSDANVNDPCVLMSNVSVLYLKHQQKQEVGIGDPLELFKQVQR